jgi:ferredoxin--NADP+ reductase
MVAERQPDFVSWADWRRLCELEETKGREQSRPRIKLTRREEVRAALGRK